MQEECFNSFNQIELSLLWTLDPKVKSTYKEIGEFNYEKLVNDGTVDKDKLRDMCKTSIMVDGSRYKGQFQKDTMIKGTPFFHFQVTSLTFFCIN